jgi:transcriptional regulator with XRE-family HTH domain
MTPTTTTTPAPAPAPARAIDVELGARIRRLRRAAGFSLDDLAARTGISKPYLSLIEGKGHVPAYEKLRRLEHALGVAGGQLVVAAFVETAPPEVRALLDKRRGGGGVAGRSRSAKGIPLLYRLPVGGFTDTEHPRRAADEHLVIPGVADADAYAVRISGDEMAPDYRDGDVVIFSPAAHVGNGDDALVRFADGRCRFARVFYGQDAAVRLQPVNVRHAPAVALRRELAGLVRAVLVKRRG